MTDEVKLIKLSASGEHVAGPDNDITGRTVRNTDGEEIGTVEDILIDPEADTARMLIVASGGFLGIGRDETFIPVELVTQVRDEVLVDLTREKLRRAPGYTPTLVPDRVYYDELYGYYEITPYWAPGFVPPYRIWP
jgi:sporulation protein YlmC with PRC-barrel domain